MLLVIKVLSLIMAAIIPVIFIIYWFDIRPINKRAKQKQSVISQLQNHEILTDPIQNHGITGWHSILDDCLYSLNPQYKSWVDFHKKLFRSEPDGEFAGNSIWIFPSGIACISEEGTKLEVFENKIALNLLQEYSTKLGFPGFTYVWKKRGKNKT